MHPNQTFRQTGPEKTIDVAKEHGFGMLAINAEAGPLVSHIPFIVSPDNSFVEAHLVRSNPIARAISEPTNAVLAVSGPHGYISPDWYGVEDQVPTWNYVAVHLRGPVKLLPDDELRGILERMSGEFENRLLPKPVWLMDKVSDDALSKLMRMIVPIRMEIETMDSTWKLGQNKTDAARKGAMQGLRKSGVGFGQDELATLMGKTIE